MSKPRKALIEAYFSTMGEMRKLNFAQHGQAKQVVGLTHAQLATLMFIHHHGLNTVKDLANYLGITPSATTQLMNGLVKQKIIIRTPDKQDRRKIILTISKQGKDAMQRIKQNMRKRFTVLLEPLSDKELTQLVALQQKILTYAKRKNSQ